MPTTKIVSAGARHAATLNQPLKAYCKVRRIITIILETGPSFDMTIAGAIFRAGTTLCAFWRPPEAIKA